MLGRISPPGWSLLPGAPALTRTGLPPARTTRLSGRTIVLFYWEYHRSMGASPKTLYKRDFVEWSARTAELLRERRFDDVDLENLIEEVEELGNSWEHAVESHLVRMMKHLIKQRIQPQRAGR